MRLIEDFLYFSVGFAARTTENLTKLIQKLIEQNKISESDGKKILDEYTKKADGLIKKFDTKLEDFISEKMRNFSFLTEDELNKIKKRIDKIEKLIDEKISE